MRRRFFVSLLLTIPIFLYSPAEMVLLSRKTSSVIRGDMIIWLFTNIFGFALVFLGLAGPALAAFYNFATDFLPLFNSARLFKR